MSVCLPNSSASKRHRQPGDEEVAEHNNNNAIEEEVEQEEDKQTELAIMESLKMFEAEKNSMVTIDTFFCTLFEFKCFV